MESPSLTDCKDFVWKFVECWPISLTWVIGLLIAGTIWTLLQ